MTWLRTSAARLLALFRRSRLDQELDEEMRFHLQMEEEENHRRGMDEEEGRRAARRSFGSVVLMREAHRERRGFPMVDEFWRDLLYGNRMLLRSPGFAGVAILSLALGIGANTAAFSVVNALLFQTLPAQDPGSLVTLHRTRNGQINSSGQSYPNYLDFRDQSKDVFSGIAAYYPLFPANLGGDSPDRIWGQLVSGNYFSVLGIQAIHGRTITRGENENPGQHPVIVISYGLWQRKFGADPGVVGRSVLLNGHPFMIVGIAPREFWGVFYGLTPEIWAPIVMREQLMPAGREHTILRQRNSNWLHVIARLKPGVSLDQAQSSVDVIGSRLEETRVREEATGNAGVAGKNEVQGFALEPANAVIPVVRRQAVTFSVTAMIVVGLVLMIACVNVTNLLLARANARQREIGIRLSLGASRWRLVRQLLSENITLALGGAAAGFALAYAATTAYSRLDFPFPLPLNFQFTPDARVLAFTVLAALLSVTLAGLAPAWQTTRSGTAGDLKRQAGGPLRRRFGLNNLLVIAQLSVSLALLISTALFLRSLQAAHSIDVGFRGDNLLLLSFDPKLQGYSGERAKAFLAELQDRIAALLLVDSVSMIDVVPLSTSSSTGLVDAEGREPPASRSVTRFLVGPNFLETIGVPLLRGRTLDQMGHGSSPAAIINQTMAERFWPGEDAVGKGFRTGGASYQVAGVVADSKVTTLEEGPTACMYRSLADEYDEASFFVGITLMVRTSGDPAALTRSVREEISAIDRNLPVFDVRTMNEHLSDALFLPRLGAAVTGVIGVVGLLLASIGLFGVVHYSVNRRTQEIGIRMALGAHSATILRAVLRQAALLGVLGVALGISLAFALTRLFSAALYGISVTDPLAFVGAPLVLTLVALLAGYVPARRASRIEPMTALRYE